MFIFFFVITVNYTLFNRSTLGRISPSFYMLTSVTGYNREVKFDFHFKIPIPQFYILYVPLHHQIRLVNIGNVPFRFLTVFQFTSYNNQHYCIIKLRFLTSLFNATCYRNNILLKTLRKWHVTQTTFVFITVAHLIVFPCNIARGHRLPTGSLR